MLKRRYAFTMIELVFVILILGILAAVAIPKLAATRDDAKMVTIAQNITIGAQEIATYAVSQGQTLDDMSAMSNAIEHMQHDGDAVLSPKKAVIKIGNVNDCITMQIVTNATEDNLTLSYGNAGSDTQCLRLQSSVDAAKYPMKLRGEYVKY